MPAIQSDGQCAACDLERSLLTERIKSSVLGATGRVCVRHFQLLHCLGRGSSGVVFAALDPHSDERIALKHFHDSASARDVRREFRAIAHVRHPNLVRLYELFSHRQSWFLTMELIEGSTILSHLRGSAPPSARYAEGALRSAFAQLCGAAHALHALGQVHLDLKPSNVLVQGERVVVLDYGLTRPFPRAASTSSSLLGGTPAYMAPEQRGSRRALSASDMYAIGLMLFEALTGSLPPYDESGVTRTCVRPSRVALQVPPDLDELCSLLLQHDPGARPSAEAVRIALSERARISNVEPASVREQAASPFVGRTPQLVALQREYAQVCEGKFRVAIIEGESGMGKTALLDQFLGQLREGSTALLLRGRCHAREHIPFNMLDEVVESLMRHVAGLTEREQLRLLPRHVAALSQIFPSVRDGSFDDMSSRPEPSAHDAASTKLRAFSALRELLARLADTAPVVISVEDVHWGDLDSMRLLRFLFAPPEAPPLLLVLTLRRELSPENPELAALREEALGSLDCVPVRLSVEALQAPEVQALTQLLRGSEPSAADRAIWQQTRGVPFLVCEVLAYCRQLGVAPERAPALSAMLKARAAGCSEEAQRLLEVVSVAGHPLPLSVALHAAGLPTATRASAELCDAKLTYGQRDGEAESIAIYHDRMTRAFAAGSDPQRVRAVHRAIADAIARSNTGDLEQEGTHRSLAGDVAQANALFVQAAEGAASQLAWHRAAALLRTALSLVAVGDTARQRLMARLALCLARGGQHSQAADVYLTMLGEEAETELMSSAVQQLLHAGRTGEGLTLLKPLFGRFGVYFPDAHEGPYAMYLRARAGVALASLPGSFSAAAVDTLEQQRARVFENVLPALSLMDPVRARIAQGQHYRHALRSRNAPQVLTAVLWELALQGHLDGKRAEKRGARLLRVISDAMSAANTTEARAVHAFAEAVYAYAYREAPYEALRACRKAERLLEQCQEYPLDVGSVVFLRSVVAELTGDFQDLRQIAASQMHDVQSELSSSPPILTLAVPLALLSQDRWQAAARFVDASPEPTMPLPTYALAVRRSDVAFYAGQHELAASTVDRLERYVHKSPLQRSPLYRGSLAFYVARSALTRFVKTRDRRDRRAVLQQLRATRGATTPRYNRAFLDLIAAGLALAEARTQDARWHLQSAALDFSACQAFHGAVCARYRLAQLEGDELALRHAEQWLSGRGVTAPERWVGVWAPIPHEEHGS